MKMSKHERNAAAKVNALYDALVSMADPETGKVAMSGPQAGALIECGATAARSYLGQLVMDGRIIQISTPKTGTPTVYRIPAMTRGDVRITWEKPPGLVRREELEEQKAAEVREKHQDVFDAMAEVGPTPTSSMKKSPSEVAKRKARFALERQECILGKLVEGYLVLYKTLEEIAYDGD